MKVFLFCILSHLKWCCSLTIFERAGLQRKIISPYLQMQLLWLCQKCKFIQYILYSGKFSREKTWIPRFLSHLQKFSPWNSGVPYQLTIGFSIPRNGHFLPIRESFLPQKFPAIWYPYCELCIASMLHSFAETPKNVEQVGVYKGRVCVSEGIQL